MTIFKFFCNPIFHTACDHILSFFRNSHPWPRSLLRPSRYVLQKVRIRPHALYIILLSNLILSSCSLISPPVPPVQTNVPEQWSRFENMPLTSENYWPYTAWWQKFNDPTLDRLMVQGLRANTTIKQADARLEQAQGQLKTVELSWLPNISAYAGYSSNPALGTPLGFYGIWPEYALFNIFNTIALQKSAKLDVTIQEKAIEATRLILIGQIANSYYTYIAQLNQLQLTDIYLNDLNEMLTIQQARYQDGISSSIEVEALIARLNNAQSQQRTIKDNLVKSANALHYLLNQNPGPIAAANKFGQVNTAYPNVATLPATVLSNRPDVAIAELQYKLSVQNKANAYTSLLPTAQLDYFQGNANVGNPNTLGNPIDMKDAYMAWIINPSVFGEIDTYNASQKEAYYGYIDVVRNALREVDDALTLHQTANERYALSYNAYLALKRKYQLNQGLYTTGINSYQATLNSKLELDQAAIEVNQMKLLQMITLVNLYQDLGGGYEVKA